jgi:hypothetical protein
MYVFPGSEEFVRELIEKHRFKVERGRDVDGRLLEGEWHFPCKSGAIIYQYDEHTWAADLLTTRQHNRLVRKYGAAMTWYGEPAEIVPRAGPGDEHTLHFPSELVLAVAEVLEVKRRRKVSEEQRRAAAERMRAHHATRRASMGRRDRAA